MDKNKRIVLIVGIIVLVLSIIGGTYAVFKWRSTDAQKTTITFAAEAGFTCSADGGGNIDVGDKKLIPTYVDDESIDNYIKQEIKTTATITKENITVYMDLWLDVKEISTQLANSDNFKYALTTSSTSNTEGVVVSGTFKDGIVGNKVKLLSGEVYTTTKTNTYYLWIWVDPAETGMMEQEFSLSLNGSCTQQETSIDSGPTGAEMLIAKSNPSTLSYDDASTEQQGEMWAFNQEATVLTEALIDYRYIGSSPNNYIDYNDEPWRIIGVFDNKIKLIRGTAVAETSFDLKNEVGSSTSINGSLYWTDAQLMYMLNPKTYTLLDGYTYADGMFYDANNQLIYQSNCLPTAIGTGDSDYNCNSFDWYLGDIALSQIVATDYYIGGVHQAPDFTGYAPYYYNEERNYEDSVWTGYVGLITASDYAYTVYNLSVESWMNYDIINGAYSNQWTVTGISGGDIGTITNTSSELCSNPPAADGIAVVPVVYLKPGIKLTGSGTINDLYKIVS